MFFHSSLLSLLLSPAFHVHGPQPMGPLVPREEATAWTLHQCFKGGGSRDCDFHAAQQRHHSQGCLQRGACAWLGLWLSCSHPASRLSLSGKLFMEQGWDTTPACGSNAKEHASRSKHLAPKEAHWLLSLHPPMEGECTPLP